MKVMVLGATGATGKILISMLLEKGYQATAYVRNPSKIQVQHSQLDVIEGEIFNTDAMALSLKGHDAVVSCLGSNTTKKSDQLTRMAQSITQAMKSSGVHRAIYMATAGIEGEFKGPMKWLLNAMIGNVIADHKEAAKYYRQAGLKTTILRPMQLSDKDHTGVYVTADTGLPKARKAVSRANVADMIMTCLEDDNTIGRSIGLAER